MLCKQLSYHIEIVGESPSGCFSCCYATGSESWITGVRIAGANERTFIERKL